MLLLSMLFALMPAWVEDTWARLGPAVSSLLSHAAGHVAFSVAELLIGAFVARQLVAATVALADCARGRRGLRNAVACGGLRVLQDTGIVVAGFYLLWGFQYARPSVESRFGWPVADGAPDDVLFELAAEMVDAANVAYLAIHGVVDAEEPTLLPDFARLDASVEAGWRRAARLLELHDASAERAYGPAKRLVTSPLLDRLGLAGFFFPFTGEANVNAGVPAVAMGQVVAHEKAHQRGINPEDEANFFGFLAAALSPDALARYSARVFAQRQLLVSLHARDPDRARELIERRLPGVQRDVDDLRAYWARHRGRSRAISQSVNDAFLKTNRVEGGIASYGRSVELMIAFARMRGGSLLRETPAR